MKVKCPICGGRHSMSRFPQDCKWHLTTRYIIAGGARHSAKTALQQIAEINREISTEILALGGKK